MVLIMSIWYDILIFLEKLKNYYNCFLRTYKNICKKKIHYYLTILYIYKSYTKISKIQIFCNKKIKNYLKKRISCLGKRKHYLIKK
jgi:hypothetical protein